MGTARSPSSALDDEAPEQIHGSDEEDLISEIEYGYELVRFYIHTSNPEWGHGRSPLSSVERAGRSRAWKPLSQGIYRERISWLATH